MALVHDMAEALVGDITPMDKIPKSEKQRRERESMIFLTEEAMMGVPKVVGEGLREVWEEYEKGETLESRFVHDVDKMELLLQMVEYERAYMESQDLDLGEFQGVAQRVELDEVKAWCKEILREREEWVEEVKERKRKSEGKKLVLDSIS